MTREEYDAECLGQALADAGFDGIIPQDKIAEIAAAFTAGLDMKSEAFGDLCIPNPQTEEIKNLKKSLRKKEDYLQDVESLWFKKACRIRGVDPDSYTYRRDGNTIEISERR